MQQPRYKLKFTSEVTEKIEKGQSIDISVALVEYNNEDRTVEDEPLASATVELVVVNADINQHDNLYNWSREDFVSNIKKARQGNSATGDVDQSVKSVVSNNRFNLIHGVKCHSGSTIFSNSSNKKVRLGVMVVSPTEERVLEGLSNPFFVRGHDRPNRQFKLRESRPTRQSKYLFFLRLCSTFSVSLSETFFNFFVVFYLLVPFQFHIIRLYELHTATCHLILQIYFSVLHKIYFYSPPNSVS